MAKYFGQHFLINKNKIRKIINALDLKPNDLIVEIGPGHGEITFAVIKKLSNLVIESFKMIAIEQDKKLAENLELKTKNSRIKNIKIIQSDALKILPKLITQLPNYPITNYKLVGNIPYYITGRLLRIIGELKNKPSLIVLTLQKEVAERICARPPRRRGSGRRAKMNLLAASVRFWAEPKIAGYISRKEFRPMPKVDSAILKLAVKKLDNREITQSFNYHRFVRVLFKQPRKTILNNLLNIGGSDVPEFEIDIRKPDLQKLLKTLNINPQSRPQDLDIRQIIKLSTLF